MNARQKAKKYKRLAEINQDKADRYDRYMRSEALSRQFQRQYGYGTIETVKIVKYWDDRFPKECVKEEIANSIAEYILENNYINFEESKKEEPYLGYTRIIATMRIAKKWGEKSDDEWIC